MKTDEYLVAPKESLQVLIRDEISTIKKLGGEDIIVYRLVPAEFGMGWTFVKSERPIPIHKLLVPQLLLLSENVVHVTGITCGLRASRKRFYGFAGCTKEDMKRCSQPRGRIKTIGLAIATSRLRNQLVEDIEAVKKATS